MEGQDGLGVCQSCAREDDDLVAVQRVYLLAAEGTEPTPSVADEVELWCFSCRSMYPHRPLEEA